MILGLVGIYGVISYVVTQRTREIGVRMALGADTRSVRGMVLRQLGLMGAVGCVIGLVAALSLSQTASSLLFRMEPTDPTVVVLAVVALAVVALLAGYIPARRASKIDPMQALRYE